jgi:hypothetical protein
MGEINVLTDIEFLAKRFKEASIAAPGEGDDPKGVYELVPGHWYLARASRFTGKWFRAEPDLKGQVVVVRFEEKIGDTGYFTLAVGEDQAVVGRGQILVFAHLGKEK